MSGIKAVLLDVNGTLYSISDAAAPAFGELGLDPALAPAWFTNILKDAFAAQLAGFFQPFREFAGDHLYKLLAQNGDSMPNVAVATDTVMAALTAAQPFPDVGPGVNALHAAGIRISVMTNGSAALAKAVLARAGVEQGALGPLMDINMAVAWKPAPAAYQFAVDKLKLQPYEVLMVAAHPWDVFAAMREGLQGAYVQREALAHWPTYLPTTPRYTVTSLEELAEVLMRP